MGTDLFKEGKMNDLKIGQKVFLYDNHKDYFYKEFYIPENIQIIEGRITDIKYSIENEIMHHDEHYLDYKPDKLHFTIITIKLNDGDEIVLKKGYTFLKWSNYCFAISKFGVNYGIFFDRNDCSYHLRGQFIKAIEYYEKKAEEYNECVDKIRKSKNKIK